MTIRGRGCRSRRAGKFSEGAVGATSGGSGYWRMNPGRRAHSWSLCRKRCVDIMTSLWRAGGARRARIHSRREAAMKKLTLDLNALVVQSFATAPATPSRGTVRGEQCTCPTACTCPGCPTCDATCPATCVNTCDDHTCANSCNGTRGGATCEYSCSYTNCGCPVSCEATACGRSPCCA